MIKLEVTGAGGAANQDDRPIYDSTGTGFLPVQIQGDGTTTWRLRARVDPAAPWEEIVSAQTANLIQSISWVPYLQLQVTAGSGKVTCWIGEK